MIVSFVDRIESDNEAYHSTDDSDDIGDEVLLERKELAKLNIEAVNRKTLTSVKH